MRLSVIVPVAVVGALLFAGCPSSNKTCKAPGDCTGGTSCVNGSCVAGAGGGDGTAGGVGGGAGGGTAGGTAGGSAGGAGGGAGGGGGATVDAGTPVTGGASCASAGSISAGRWSSTTVGATNTFEPDCSALQVPGPDRLYAIDVPAGQRLTATVTPVIARGSALQYDPAAYIIEGPASNCALADGGVACFPGSDSSTALEAPESVTYVNLTSAPKTVYLVVDSYWEAPDTMNQATSEGAFSIDVTFDVIPEGDTCGNATTLTSGTLSGQTTDGFSNDYVNDTGFTGCARGALGSDRVYEVTVPPGKRATVTVSTGADAGFDPSVNLVDSPATTCDVHPRVCLTGANTDSPDIARWVNSTSSPHQVFAIVDSTAGSVGGYDISLAIDDPPPGEVCGATAPTLTPGTPLTGQDLTSYGGDYDGSGTLCQGDSGPDRVYQVSVPTGKEVIVTATPQGQLDLVLSIAAGATQCKAGPCAASSSSGSPGAASIVTWTNRQATDALVYVLVDTGATGGTFDISAVVQTPPPGDICQTAATITSGQSLGGQTTVGYSDDYETASDAIGCATGTFGKDRVYSVTIPAGQRGVVTVTPGGDGGFDPSLNLIDSPAETCDAQPRTCVMGVNMGSVGEPETLKYFNASSAPKTMYAIVDSFAGGEGAYEVSFNSLAPIDDDTCTSAKTTLVSGTPATAQSFSGFSIDYGIGSSNSCVTYPGVDRVYVVSVPAGQQVNAQVAPTITTDAGVDATLNLVAGPAANCEVMAHSCQGASSAGGAGVTERAAYLNQTSGSQDVFVLVGAGTSATPAGTFTVTATVASPVQGETCTTPVTIAASGTRPSVALSGASREYAFTGSGCHSYAGPEQVYAVTLSANQTVTATATPKNDSDVVLHLIEGPAANCAASTAACLRSADTKGRAMGETVTYQNTGTGSKVVFVIVSSYYAESTLTYDLNVVIQ